MVSLFSALFCVNIFLICNSNGHLLIDKLRVDFLKLEEDSWEFVLDQYKYSNANSTDDPGASLISVFENYDQELQKMPPDILYGMEVVRQTPPFLFLYSDLRLVNDMYEKFRRFLKNSVASDNTNISVIDEREDKMTYIIEEILYEPKTNMNKTIANIFQQTFLHSENEDENLVSHIINIMVDSDYMCKHYKQPPQQVFYHLYNIIALAHLKGYIMMQFSYLAQKLVQEGNFTSESLIARKQFERTTKNMIVPLGTIMRGLSRKMWRCDPKRHIKGSTYDELTALIQGHIENEVDMNSGGSCKQNCAAYSYTKSYGCYDSGSAYCQKRKSCNGKILDCKFIESAMTACISPFNSYRRYEYIKYSSGKLLGQEESCQSKKDVESWHRWFVHCSYCLCLCDQEGQHSDRYFNLRPVLADVANNRVVTGLRIVKHNRIIHLQIQEGKLLPYGYIDPSTVRWVPVDDYKITNRGVHNGIDFHTMNYRERTMFLDDLKPHEENHIITGVRFEYLENHLKFEINVRSFEFETGIISKDSYYIYGSETSSRKKLSIRDTGIPTESTPSVPHFESESYVEFTHTSFDKDAAQTTIPFFDTQPVAADPPVPLKGAGIYYKGNYGYGGFVAPTITTLDFSNRIKVELPTIKPRIEKEFPIVA